jgi:hypothetical protein
MSARALRSARLAALVVVALAAAGFVRAQDAPQKPPNREPTEEEKERRLKRNRKAAGRHQWGPLYFTPRLQLKDAGYDTNVFHSLSNPTEDAVIVLSPRVDGTLFLGSRLQVTGYGFLEQVYYRRENEESATNFFGEGRADLELGPVTLFGGGSGGQFTQRFSIELDDRVEYQQERGFVGATWRMTRRISATGQASSEEYIFAPSKLRNGQSAKEAFDRNSITGSATLRYALTKRTGLAVSADAIEDRFLSQPATVPRVFQSYRYMAGLEFGERAAINGHVLAGLRDLPATLAQGSAPYQGPVINADLVVPLGRSGRVRVVGLRDANYASNFVDLGRLHYRNVFIYKRAHGELSFDLPAAFIATGAVSGEEARYVLPYPYPDEFHLARRLDHRLTVGATLQRRFGETFRIGGYITWDRLVSTLPAYSYQGARYGLSAEIVP